LVARHEIGADVLLAHVELVLARQPPVALARAHVGEQEELDSVGLHGPVLERTHDLVVAAGNGQSELARHATPLRRDSLGRRGPALIATPRAHPARSESRNADLTSLACP